MDIAISPAAVTLTANSNTVTYNGEEQSVSGFTASVENLTFADTVTAGGSGTDAADYEVTFGGVTVNETKDTTGNYVVTETITGTLAISKKALTITAGSSAKNYDGTELTYGEYSATNLGTGDVLEAVTVTGGRTDVGSSDNVASAAVIKKGETDVTANYEITYVNGTLTVNRATDNNVTLSITGWTYGDDANAPTASAQFGTDTIVYTYSDARDGEFTSEVPVNAGTWYVKASVAATDNYAAGEAVAEFKISTFDKKELDAAIAEAEEYLDEISENSDYAEIAKNLDDAIEAAGKIADDANVTAAQIDAAAKALKEALAAAKAALSSSSIA